MSVYKSTTGIPLTYELGIAGVQVNYQAIDQLELELAENKHDMLRLIHKGLHPKAIVDYLDAPVRIDMHTGPGYSQTFCGSVSSIQPVSTLTGGLVNDSPFQMAEIICLGASYNMRGRKSYVWGTTTLVDVATQLAKRYGFSLDVPNDPLILPIVVQADESDWQFLVRLAGMHGYKVTCHGTHLHIFDPHKARDRQISLHTLITGKVIEGTPIPGVVTKFDGDFARRHADGEHMDSVVTVITHDGASFDVRTSEVLGKSTPARFENRLADDVHNYAEALRLVQQEAHETDDFHADVNVTGMLGAVPGGMVNLTEYKGGFDGWWYVESVKHTANSSMFVTDLCVARNKTTQLEGRSGTPRFMVPPSPAFVKGTFRASKAVHNVY